MKLPFFEPPNRPHGLKHHLMRSNQLLYWKFLDCYSNILNFSLFYTKKRFNKKWWRNYNVSAALNEDMESGSWFHVRRSYFAKYGENEVIIMDDMPNVLTCTNVHLSLGSEIPLRMNLWINMLSWFFFAAAAVAAAATIIICK